MPKPKLRQEIERLSTKYFNIEFTRATNFPTKVRSLAEEMFYLEHCGTEDAKVVRQAMKVFRLGKDISESMEVE